MEAISKNLEKDLDNSNPKKIYMLISLYTLLTSLGRSKEVNKKIVKETFQDQGVEFFNKIGKQLVEAETETEPQKELKLALIKTIANFGLDLKDFVSTKGLLENLVDVILSGIHNSTLLTQSNTFSKKELNEK